MKSLDSIKAHEYGINKEIVRKKEEIKCTVEVFYSGHLL